MNIIKKDNQNKYERYTAGSLMTRDVPVVNTTETVGDIEKIIIRDIEDFDTINYIYIIDSQRKLRGVISIKELYKQKNSVLVKDVMTKDFTAVRSSTDQERVVYKALENNIKAVPVIDKTGRFLGVVKSDNILLTLYNEVGEDMLQMAGVSGTGKGFDDVMKISILKSFSHRFPWLFVGLVGGIIISKIIGFFETTLSQNLIIAAFIPLMSYMASAVGTQMGVFIIRDLAINPSFIFVKYFLRQFVVVFLIGVASSVIFFLINMSVNQDILTGFAISVAMFVAILSSVFTGLVVPYLLNKLKFDPANASGPLGTIIQDTLTIVIYFLVASVML